ncbi:MAG: 6-hydroxymethylpterin diphosphokinase MptE-like protein [Spirochaetia bacterium]
MLELFRAKSGDLTASVSGGLLHSRYDPRREAERYLDRALGNRNRGEQRPGQAQTPIPATVLLLGAGLGYLASAIRQRLPQCHLIAVSALNAVQDEHRPAIDVYVDLSAGKPAERLSRAVRPADVAGLELLEWEPELRAAPQAAEAARTAVRELVARYNADVATTGFFGRRYIRNAVRTLLFSQSARASGPGTKPVCIAASGPSIERSSLWIAENRSRIEVWALSSATPALRARGITPDLVVHQDAGYYATLHLAEAASAEMSPILMPATAALPPRELRSAPILFHQGTELENELFSALGIEPPRTSETGTVAATATLLALARSPGTVYLAGLDLSRDDIRAHATPHAFEPYLSRCESRFRPLYSQLAADAFERSEPPKDPQRHPRTQHARQERSLDIYASWFRTLPARLTRRLRRLSPSPVDIGIEALASGEQPGTRAGGGAEAGGGAANESARQARSAWEPLPLPSRKERIAALRSVLAGWRGEIRRFTGAHTVPEPSELAYLISAADYVSAVAAGRRGDHAARARSLARLSEVSDQLFARIEFILERVTEQER